MYPLSFNKSFLLSTVQEFAKDSVFHRINFKGDWIDMSGSLDKDLLRRLKNLLIVKKNSPLRVVKDELEGVLILEGFPKSLRTHPNLDKDYVMVPVKFLEALKAKVLGSDEILEAATTTEAPATSTEEDEDLKLQKAQKAQKALKRKEKKIRKQMAQSELPMLSSNQVEALKKAPSCEKCTRTKTLSKTFKDQLKESKILEKEALEKLSNTEKELKNAKTMLNEAEDNLAQEAKDQEAEMKALLAELEQLQDAANGGSGLSKTMKKVLIALQDKLDVVRAQDPVGSASQKVMRLSSLTDSSFVRECAEYELLKVKLAFQKYEQALEHNIDLIQQNPLTISPSNLLPVPESPELPEVFFRELKKAEDRQNKELEQECPICQDPMENEKEELFNCPVCRKDIHLGCLEQWWKMSDTCPCCRAAWK